ncbi:hypothetical protein [Parvibaculum sp.]|uniref:hypothetical protein n=1 Tax=Parvibaculum sp. TaxID=2024848 RepID=UPI00320E1DA5
MSEELVWGIVFVLSALGGIGGLILLHRSALNDALTRATRDKLDQIGQLKDAADKASEIAAAELQAAAARLAEADKTATATRVALEDQIQALEGSVKSLESEVRATQDTLSAKESELRPYLAKEQGLRGRLDAMKAVWLSPQMEEGDCQTLLARNLWVLYPDYVVDHRFHIDGETWISTAFKSHFERDSADWVDSDKAWRLRVGASCQPDFCGPAISTASFDQPEDVYLIIELKRPNVTICWDHIEQVHAYALSLMLNVGKNLREKRIDCLVIGGALSDDVNDAHLRWGKEAHHAIRIVPMTYAQLHDRACRIAAPFLDGAFADAEAAVPPIAQLEEATEVAAA